MRLSGTKATAIHQYRGLGNQLWDLAGNRPSLDLRFADSKSLVDATTGTNLVDFTRASSGTYVGSDGLIKTATTNLLLRSEEFETTWVLSALQSFGSGSIANAIAAPDGTTTADKLVEDNSPSASQHYAYQLVPVIAGLPYTVSVYAKAAERQEIFLALATFNSAFLSNTSSYFNLVSGTTRAVGINATASIVDAGGGWYRCSLTGIAQTSTTAIISGGAISNGSTFFYAGNGTSGIYLWGAQLEQSSTVGEYIPTTSVINSAPRFDHDPTTGESLGLLVEEQRSNLLLNSGTLSTQSVTVTAVNHTLSFTGTGTITLSGASTAGPLVGTGTGEASRVSLTFTPTAGSLTLTVSGTVTNAQLEIGAFRTSYIPTTTSAVTRAADTCSISGSNFSSWYRQDEGTVFADAEGSGPLITPRATASAGDRIQLSIGSSAVVVGGSIQANFGNTTAAKRVLAYKLNNTNAAFDGELGVNDTSCTIPSVDYATIGYFDFGGALRNNGAIKRITFWPQRLSDSTLSTITQ